jgi:hypothetical protein
MSLLILKTEKALLYSLLFGVIKKVLINLPWNTYFMISIIENMSKSGS